MIEILCAAFVPPLVLWLLSGTRLFDDEARRAARRWFIPLALAWFAPCWLTGRTPAPFDYLKQTVIPWQTHGFTSANELLSDVPLQLVPWTIVVRALRPVRIRTWEVKLPGWRLTRNGARWPIVGTADPLVVFDAPAGESRFELRYLPVGFKMGLLLAAGGVLILLAMLRPRMARLRAAKGAGR